MPSLGPAEILVVLVVALLVFGPDKMPEIAKQVGKGFREFRRMQQHLKSELRDVVSEFDSGTSTTTVGPDPVPMLPPKEDPAAPPAVASSDAAPASSAPALPAPEAAAPAAPPASSEPDAPRDPA
jgi:sec-independent protein translocase protein TatA